MSPGARFNIASHLPRQADERPYQQAVVMPLDRDAIGKRKYSHLTFAQLDALCDAYAHGLVENGFERGDRVLLMVRQGLELIALTFALFKIGAVPILIDPGMGRESFLKCVERSEPNAMVGIPLAHAARLVFRGAFRSVRRKVSTRAAWWNGAVGLDRIARHDAGPFLPAATDRDDLCAILFTSGSTGPPKGVLYTHGIFDGQVSAIRDMYAIAPGDVAVPGFPLFALFSVAMGMTCVIPDMDPAKPAQVDPANLVEAIEDFGADMAFGSPAIWNVVARHCEEHDITLPSLSKLLTFGAAISPGLMERWEAIMPTGHVHTPYGATESLPVATISSEEVLAETAALSREGRGICVGRPVDDVEVRIIAIDDEPISDWSDAVEVEPSTIGEICVRGPMVTAGYDREPRHDELSKIAHGETFWHRMGDVGYFDEDGRLWFCGRKSHRVETASGTLFSVPCEAILDRHPKVYRSALIGLGPTGRQVPALVVEPEPGSFPKDGPSEELLRRELLELLRGADVTRDIEHVFFHESFPVDRRHNAKIHRRELADAFAAALR